MTHLQIGDTAPVFSGVDQNENPISLADFAGKKLILFFYPKANTPGCTAQGCNLRDNYSILKDKGYEILGVSADSPKRQSNFIEKYSFPFPLLADQEKEVIKSYGVWGPKKFMGRVFSGLHRITFVIDENGIIENIISKVKTKDHAAQILETL